MLAESLGDLLLSSWAHQSEEAVLARDQSQWARLRGEEQPLRLADGHPRAEKDGDAAWSEEWRLLAHGRAFDAIN
jgi:hypothetical protein